MKALTICQPYAQLIVSGEKKVENRSWPTSYRGPLAIHAGRSRDRLDADDDNPGHDLYGFRIADLPFGAVVAVAELVDCFRVRKVDNPTGVGLPPYGLVISPVVLALRPWLRDHRHVEGPECWVLAAVRPLAEPVACRGLQGLWTLPAGVEAAVLDKLGSGVA